MGPIKQTNSVAPISFTPGRTASRAPAIGVRVASNRFGADRAAAALRNSSSPRLSDKHALCKGIRTAARHAALSAEINSPDELAACCNNLSEAGRNLLENTSGKHVKGAIAAALRKFMTETRGGISGGDLQQVARSCQSFSQELDRIIGTKQPAAQAKANAKAEKEPGTKKAFCSRIQARAAQLNGLVTQGICSSRQMTSYCRFLAKDGEAILSLANGRAVRAAVTRAIDTFKRDTMAAHANGDLAAMARLCTTYAQTLAGIVGVEKPKR